MASKNTYTVISTTSDIMGHPDAPESITNNDSQMIFGETFEGLEERGAHVFGRSLVDGYEGHVHKNTLHLNAPAPTHWVKSRITHIYPIPNFKSRPVMALSFLSRVCIDTKKQENGFVYVPDFGWMFAVHLTASLPLTLSQPPSLHASCVQSMDHTDKPCDDDTKRAENILNTALLLLGTPYLYGGRSCFGIDCSGLVQMALLANNIPCPRDSGDQAQALGTEISQNDLARGDLVFFKGHVGIMMNSENILNATARTMDTRIEPLSNLIDFYGDITYTRRI